MSYLRHKQQGLSLVELMVALTLGMVLMAGFLQIFMSVRSTYATNEASSRLQENGRFALDFLAQHARLAGYRDPSHAATGQWLHLAIGKSGQFLHGGPERGYWCCCRGRNWRPNCLCLSASGGRSWQALRLCRQRGCCRS